ncbi:thioesterase domain-containing protein [Shewanella maritima]|uniref:thioesterase domain-containing protein n=1 Tax=Shewanella maritima TaxID=2520507 RepID=UPI0037363665
MDSLLAQLQTTWYQTIPISEFMQIQLLSFQNDTLTVTAPLAPNINLHHTMFAGSIYTLMTLTGWGMVWLQQQLSGVDGDIVLADANVRFLAPVDTQPVTKVTWLGQDASVLGRGKRLRAQLQVELMCGDKLCAVFNGKYVSLPVKDTPV